MVLKLYHVCEIEQKKERIAVKGLYLFLKDIWWKDLNETSNF